MKEEENMSDFMNEKRDELAQEMGWSQDRAQGYVDGESTERNGLEMPPFHKVAMDDYSKGFRTGYYTQACSVSVKDIREAVTA